MLIMLLYALAMEVFWDCFLNVLKNPMCNNFCLGNPTTHNLPPKNKSFIGRSRELKLLRETLFVRKACDRMAIVGLGGTGRLRLR